MSGTGRYDELDAARGIAILMMVLFHTLFDLYFFSVYPVEVTGGFWRYFAFATASLFLLIAGMSLSISHARFMQRDPPPSSFAVWKKYAGRGAFVFSCGLLVTAATYFYLGEGFVVFGILHVIGVSIALSPLFFRFREWNVAIGAAFVAAGIAIPVLSVYGPAFLLPIGIHPASFWSVDYEPVFPWAGLVLAGIGLGSLLYPEGRRAFEVPPSAMPAVSLLAIPGRHSLVIYLLHQPVLLLLLQFVTGHPVFW